MQRTFYFFHTDRTRVGPQMLDRLTDFLVNIGRNSIEFPAGFRLYKNVVHGILYLFLTASPFCCIFRERNQALGVFQGIRHALAADTDIFKILLIERVHRFANQRGKRRVPLYG